MILIFANYRFSVDWSTHFKIYVIPLYIYSISILSCIRPVPNFHCLTSEILY
jgi:hypothetical protein